MTNILKTAIKNAVFFVLCGIAFAQAAEVNVGKITMEDLSNARNAYQNLLVLDDMNRKRPDSEAYVFARILEIQADHSFNTNSPELEKRRKEKYYINGGKYIYFTMNEIVKPKSYSCHSNYRLDIEGPSTENNNYVRLQLQNHKGKRNSYASILLPREMPIHVNLLYFALNLSCHMLFERDVEQMREYTKTVDQPFNIKLDDPIFTQRNAHIKEKRENIQEALQEDKDLGTYKHDKAAKDLKSYQEREAAKNRKLPPFKKWVE